jgi:hypothetical protein
MTALIGRDELKTAIDAGAVARRHSEPSPSRHLE